MQIRRTTMMSTASLFDREFDELYDLSFPFMSEFLRRRVKKLRREAEMEDISDMRRREIYNECLGEMAKGLEFQIASISLNMDNDPKKHIQRLRKVVDWLLVEARDKK